MSTNQNRLIATARQYALVTFLGLGMSFAVAKTAVNTQNMVTMDEPEWVLKPGATDLTNPASYELNTTTTPLESLCPGDEQVCGIKAPNDGTNHPSISNDLKQKINAGIPDNSLFMRN